MITWIEGNFFWHVQFTLFSMNFNWPGPKIHVFFILESERYCQLALIVLLILRSWCSSPKTHLWDPLWVCQTSSFGTKKISLSRSMLSLVQLAFEWICVRSVSLSCCTDGSVERRQGAQINRILWLVETQRSAFQDIFTLDSYSSLF